MYIQGFRSQSVAWSLLRSRHKQDHCMFGHEKGFSFLEALMGFLGGQVAGLPGKTKPGQQEIKG